MSYVSALDLGKRKDYSALCVLRKTVTQEPLRELERVAVGPTEERGPGGPVKIIPFRPAITVPKTRTTRNYEMPAMSRYDLGTDYGEIVSAVVQSFAKPPLRGSTLAIDKTGVGEAVCEMFVRGFREIMAPCYNCKGAGRTLATGPIPGLGAGFFEATTIPCGLCKGSGKMKAAAILRPITITGGQVAAPTPDGAGWRVPKRELVSAVDSLLSGRRLRIPATLPMRNIDRTGVSVNGTPLLLKELENFKTKVKLDTGNIEFSAWRERDHDDMVLACAMAAWVGEFGQQTFWVA